MKIILCIALILTSCENSPTEISPKKVVSLNRLSTFLDIYSDSIPPLNRYQNIQNKLLINIVENRRDENLTHYKVRLDVNHVIGPPEYGVDFGQIVSFGDVLFSRQRKEIYNNEGNLTDIKYTFMYHYDSDINNTLFPTQFNFSTRIKFSNVNENNQSSSKRIKEINSELNFPKRLQIANIAINKLIDTQNNLNLLFNRDVASGNALVGFNYEVDSVVVNQMTLIINANGAIISIDQSFLNTFKNEVGLPSFNAVIWIAESYRLSQSISSQDKTTNESYSTPIYVSNIQSIPVKF